MTWNGTKTWAPGEKGRSTDFNDHISDNLDWLFQRPAGAQDINEASNYTTTSGTFADIDATDLSVTIDVQSGAVEVHFHGSVRLTNSGPNDAHVYFDVTVDGTRHAGDDGIITAARFNPDFVIVFPVSFTRRIEGLSPGSHTFRLQWRVASSAGTTTATLYAGAGTTRADVHPQFWVADRG